MAPYRKKRDKLSFARELGSISFDPIRVSVQIVHKNTMIALIDDDDERSVTHFEMFDETKSWEQEGLYVNRFLSNDVEDFDMAESDDTL